MTNVSLWPSKANASDFIQQSNLSSNGFPFIGVDVQLASLFLSQSNELDPLTTLYTVFFGIK